VSRSIFQLIEEANRAMTDRGQWGGPAYLLVRSRNRRKSLSVRVDEDAKIVVHVPYRTPGWEIERFLSAKRAWIEKRVADREQLIRENRRAYVPGERFLYLGEWYPLEIEEAEGKGEPLALRFGRFVLQKHQAARTRDLLLAWYRREAERTLSERLAFHCQRLCLLPSGMRITNARSRWGSCSADNRVAFSWRIVMASLKIIDYLLVHELAHIREKNHSARFWRLVESAMPDYRERRRWLRNNGHRLILPDPFVT
jgi:predicted metal-dependent hydrolase